jgi:hypothetical protein
MLVVVEARSFCVGGNVLRIHGCWKSFVGVQDVVVTSVMVGRRRCSLSGFQISVSLTEECETVGEARPGVFRLKQWKQGGSTIVCVQLEGDKLMVEEFREPLGLAAGYGFGVAQR